jgi:serine/threonine-protein kinase RsbW
MKSEMAFKRTLGSLDAVFDFIDAFTLKSGIGKTEIFPIELAVEELFTNMVKYQKESVADIAIVLESSDRKLIVTLTDPDCEPFDVLKSAEPLLNQPLSERTSGGLGVYLTKKMVDALDYQYANRRSVITLTKNLEG